MNATLWILLVTLVILPNFSRALDLDRYAWEFPVATAIPRDQVADSKPN